MVVPPTPPQVDPLRRADLAGGLALHAEARHRHRTHDRVRPDHAGHVAVHRRRTTASGTVGPRQQRQHIDPSVREPKAALGMTAPRVPEPACSRGVARGAGRLHDSLPLSKSRSRPGAFDAAADDAAHNHRRRRRGNAGAREAGSRQGPTRCGATGPRRRPFDKLRVTDKPPHSDMNDRHYTATHRPSHETGRCKCKPRSAPAPAGAPVAISPGPTGRHVSVYAGRLCKSRVRLDQTPMRGLCHKIMSGFRLPTLTHGSPTPAHGPGSPKGLSGQPDIPVLLLSYRSSYPRRSTRIR
jgi:hypothetical protein